MARSAAGVARRRGSRAAPPLASALETPRAFLFLAPARSPSAPARPPSARARFASARARRPAFGDGVEGALRVSHCGP